MRYRALDKNGDMQFGKGRSEEFLVNSPACVAQAVLTALRLHQGEFFLDATKGVPYETQILGYGTASLYDAVIKNAILGVQGVSSILAYSSSLNRANRTLSVSVTINTIYSGAAISVSLSTGYGYLGYGELPYGGALRNPYSGGGG